MCIGVTEHPEDSTAAEMDLDYLAAAEIAANYRVRRSIRCYADQPPPRLEFYSACVVAVMQNNSNDVPATLNDAVQKEDARKWREVMGFEFRSFTDMNIWELVKRPKSHKRMKAKCVFNIQRDEIGNVSRYRAGLGAVGLFHDYGNHYHKVLSPVSRYAMVRMKFYIAVLFS